MKVLFIQTVPKIGKSGEVKNVPDGYVRNFLLPKKLVKIATPKVIADLKKEKQEKQAHKDIQVNLFKKNLKALKGVGGVAITVKANEKGHLFKAVHEKDILEALSKQHGVELLEEFIKLESPIKELGTHKVLVEAVGVKEELEVLIEQEKSA